MNTDLFGGIIAMQTYQDTRVSTKALMEVQVDSTKSMAKDMNLGNQLERLSKWQQMYAKNKVDNPSDARDLTTFITDMQKLLALV